MPSLQRMCNDSNYFLTYVTQGHWFHCALGLMYHSAQNTWDSFLILYLHTRFSEETNHSISVGKCTKGRIWPAVTQFNLQGAGEHLGNLVLHFNLVLLVPDKGKGHRTQGPRDRRIPGLTPCAITGHPVSRSHHQASSGEVT